MSILAMLVLHNFIRFHDPSNSNAEDNNSSEGYPTADDQPGAVSAAWATGSCTTAETCCAEAKRAEIASVMWNNYQCILTEHGR